MDDVKLRAGFFGQQRGPLDRFHLGYDRAGREKISHTRLSLRAASSGESGSNLLALRVYRDRQIDGRSFTQSFEERNGVVTRKFGESRVAEERLEPDDAAIRQLRHLAYTAGNQSAPQREVRDGSSFERGALPVELTRVHSAGRRV